MPQLRPGTAKTKIKKKKEKKKDGKRKVKFLEIQEDSVVCRDRLAPTKAKVFTLRQKRWFITDFLLSKVGRLGYPSFTLMLFCMQSSAWIVGMLEQRRCD